MISGARVWLARLLILAGVVALVWAGYALLLSRRAQLEEAFLVYLPFWTVWSRAAAWAFGQEKVGSGDRARYEPREVRVVQEMTWNGAACDVGEFGVNQVPLSDGSLEPFDCLVAGRWSRQALQGVAWASSNAASVAEDTASELVVRLRGGKELQPLDLAAQPGIRALLTVVDVEELTASG